LSSVSRHAGVTLRPYEAGDEQRLLDAFNDSFGRVDPDFRERSLAEWRWRFLDNPYGVRIMLALDVQGNLLAQYAGMPRAALVDGRRVTLTHAVDSFSVARSGLARRSVFVQTCEAFIAAFRSSDPFIWGLPVRSAWRIGQRALGYELVQPVWSFALESLRPTGGTQVEVEECGHVPAEIDELFARVASEQPALCVRDHAALTWRYTNCPSVDYRMLCARRGAQLIGWCAFREGGFDGQTGTLLCDWVVPASERAGLSALIERVFACARDVGGLPLRTACAIDSWEWEALQEVGFRVRPTRYIIAGRSFERARPASWYARSLRWTLGDTDLV